MVLVAVVAVGVVGVLDFVVGVSAFVVVGVLVFRYLREVRQLALSMKPALFLVTILSACLLFE
jgi:hypothetical protein